MAGPGSVGEIEAICIGFAEVVPRGGRDPAAGEQAEQVGFVEPQIRILVEAVAGFEVVDDRGASSWSMRLACIAMPSLCGKG